MNLKCFFFIQINYLNTTSNCLQNCAAHRALHQNRFAWYKLLRINQLFQLLLQLSFSLFLPLKIARCLFEKLYIRSRLLNITFQGYFGVVLRQFWGNFRVIYGIYANLPLYFYHEPSQTITNIRIFDGKSSYFRSKGSCGQW